MHRSMIFLQVPLIFAALFSGNSCGSVLARMTSDAFCLRRLPGSYACEPRRRKEMPSFFPLSRFTLALVRERLGTNFLPHKTTSPVVSNMFRLFAVSLALVGLARAFPQGGSVESCDSLLPRHIHTEPKSPRESPFTFIASSSTYSNQNSVHGIQVEIAGSTFKGFMVAAIDPDTHKRIGRFQEVKGTQPLPCSAITHSDGQLKKRVSLLWVPPSDIPKGNVIFMATVVKSYSNYYANLIAAVPSYSKSA